MRKETLQLSPHIEYLKDILPLTPIMRFEKWVLTWNTHPLIFAYQDVPFKDNITFSVISI